MNGPALRPFRPSPEAGKSAEICGDEPFGSVGERSRKFFWAAALNPLCDDFRSREADSKLDLVLAADGRTLLEGAPAPLMDRDRRYRKRKSPDHER
jgi:hypothetical protein